MTPTQAAAERRRKHLATSSVRDSPYSYQHHAGGWYIHDNALKSDNEVLADAYLDLVPADSDQPADETWLLEQKELSPERTTCGVKLAVIRPYILYEYEPECGLESWYLGQYEIWKRKPVTRGQVRRLLAALGVGT